ncbi:MAG: hypothetical protein NTV71_00475 [Candidatus Omnitrophica bacterium]|nr:hypothetical protein [Candidatus Omnitrophota bacterium]
MKKRNKIINTVIIFIAMGVFLWHETVYALRPPLQCSSTQRESMYQPYKQHILRIHDLLSIVSRKETKRKNIKAEIISALQSIQRDSFPLFKQRQVEKIARLKKLSERLSILEHLISYQIERSGKTEFLFNGTHIAMILESSRSEAEIANIIKTLKSLGITQGTHIALILQSSRSNVEIKSLIKTLKILGITEGYHIALILQSSRSEAEIENIIKTLKSLGIIQGTHIALILQSSRSNVEIKSLINALLKH